MNKFAKLAALGLAAVSTLAMAGADSFNAYLAIQTDVYTFRNSVDDKDYGRDEAKKAPEGFDYGKNLIYWQDDAGMLLDVTIKDAEVTGNGDYSVSISDIAWPAGDAGFNMIFVSTDVKYDDSGDYANGYFSSMETLFDGKSVNKVVESDLAAEDGYKGVYTLEKTDAKLMTYCSYNKYGDVSFDFSDMPSSIEVKFTVAGLDAAAETPDAPAATEAPAADDKNDTSAPAATQKPATDSTAKTGDATSVVALAGVALVAVLGLVASKKSRA